VLRKVLAIGAVLALLWVRGSGAQGEGTPYVTGTVTYLQRMALPADAVVVVRLQDVSFQNVQPAKVIAEQTVALDGKQVPVPFTISYAEADIDPAHSYAVRATIRTGGKLLFSSMAYPVITGGAPKTVEIRMQLGAAAGAAPSTNGRAGQMRVGAAIELLGTEWRLTEIVGNAEPKAAIETAGQGASLILHAEGETLSGSSGCNRLVGTFKLHGHALYFEPVGLTRMACPEPTMKLERAFVEALNATTRYGISGDVLELRRDEQVVARFRASLTTGNVGEAGVVSESTGDAGDTAHAKGPESWLGQWDGPEGTYMILTKEGPAYSVAIRSLDGVQTYEGVASGDHIEFKREGATETIRAGSGVQTGMKWLADKKNCVVVKSGEGYCRQ
jgi:uncharacterized lipoprotein YbaY